MIKIDISDVDRKKLEKTYLGFFEDKKVELGLIKKEWEKNCRKHKRIYRDPDNRKACPLQREPIGGKRNLDIELLKELLLANPGAIVDGPISKLNKKQKHLRKYSDLLGFYHILGKKIEKKISKDKWEKKANHIISYLNINPVDEHPALWRYLYYALNPKKVLFSEVSDKLKEIFQDPDIKKVYAAYENFYDRYEELAENVKVLFDKMFDYDNMLTTKNRFELFKAINVGICPYCNRQFISVINTDIANKSTATFDHYFREEPFPLFKLTLYNLVPSCYTCNSLLKRTSDVRHLNPWFEGADEKLKFTFGKIDPSVINGYDQYLDSYYGVTCTKEVIGESLTFTSDKVNQHTQGSKEVFRLEEIYHSHSDYAGTIVAKALRYETSNLKEQLMDMLKDAKCPVDDSLIDKFLYDVDLSISTDQQALHIPLFKLKMDMLNLVKEVAKKTV